MPHTLDGWGVERHASDWHAGRGTRRTAEGPRGGPWRAAAL